MLSSKITKSFKLTNVLDFSEGNYQNLNFKCRNGEFEHFFFNDLRDLNRQGRCAGYVLQDALDMVGYFTIVADATFSTKKKDENDVVYSVDFVSCSLLDRLAKNSLYSNPDAGHILLAEAITFAKKNYMDTDKFFLKATPLHVRAKALIQDFGGFEIEGSNEYVIYLDSETPSIQKPKISKN